MTPGTRRTVILISGMRGNKCREQITGVLESVAGVETVDVNLYRARATIIHGTKCDAAELIRSVRRAGYIASVSEEGGEVGAAEAGDNTHRS